eukprot:TRINITY_DN12948_c0_g1_i14.p1 TRINITY_DN12948_c0_g1~~TRINITY_DN12948_c0_g1_i14.p1  ORF type:complete len:112 (-),score=25.87 TRINITY_DN12948_c0_g1_i14:29-364(-)
MGGQRTCRVSLLVHALTRAWRVGESASWRAEPDFWRRVQPGHGEGESASWHQSMEKVSLPAGLQSLTFGARFNQRMEKVSLPAGLQSLTFGADFNQSKEKVSLPVDCRVTM